MQALIFDCDGVLADTERDGHRVAFNRAFEALGLNMVWDTALYGRLLHVAGGKERLQAYFDRVGWPVPAEARDDLVRSLHEAKSRAFVDLLTQGAIPARPGVGRLVDEARAAELALAVCSTSKLESVQACLALLGADRAAAFDLVLAGDVVPRKKPDPEIYLLASQSLGVAPEECIVIEDSAIGCRAALAAGMRCVITRSAYTRDEDFAGACLVVDELGDGPGAVTLATISQYMEVRP